MIDWLQVGLLAAELGVHCRSAAGVGLATEAQWRQASAGVPGPQLWLPAPGEELQAGASVALLRRAYAEHLIRAKPAADAAPAPLPNHWAPLERCTVLEVRCPASNSPLTL